MSPLLGFTKLLPALLDGSKTQTIRVPRKTPIRQGDLLYVYWKLRTKACQQLGMARAIFVQRLRLDQITDQIARQDGFIDRQACLRGLRLLHPRLSDSDFVDVIQFLWVDGPYPILEAQEKPKQEAARR